MARKFEVGLAPGSLWEIAYWLPTGTHIKQDICEPQFIVDKPPTILASGLMSC